MKLDKRFNMLISSKELAMLRALATRDGLNPSSWIRLAIRHAWDKRKKEKR